MESSGLKIIIKTSIFKNAYWDLRLIFKELSWNCSNLHCKNEKKCNVSALTQLKLLPNYRLTCLIIQGGLWRSCLFFCQSSQPQILTDFVFCVLQSLCERWLHPQNGEPPLKKFHLSFKQPWRFSTPPNLETRYQRPLLLWVLCGELGANLSLLSSSFPHLRGSKKSLIWCGLSSKTWRLGGW